jgi:hypothetical protein
MTSPLDRSLYEVFMDEKCGPMIYLNPPTYYELTYRPKEPIPETLANIIGHAFGDLRAALDYIAQRIVRSGIPDFDAKKNDLFPGRATERPPSPFQSRADRASPSRIQKTSFGGGKAGKRT